MNQRKRLKILTLDGGGLQALVTLSILKEVCRAIARQNEAARPPAPHELFDLIGGVGTGGWIALLLGRYRLDIATCMAVYMDIARDVDIAANGLNQSRKSRPYKLEQDRLIKVVKGVFERHNLDPALLSSSSELKSGFQDGTSRCKYSFAAGVVQRIDKQTSGFQLFRSYAATGFDRNFMRPGPEPENCKLPQVFAATGAAKFFLPPCKVGSTVFFDETFPQSHPITSIALDEAFGIYGSDVEISVLLNIGPGIPSEKDRLTLEDMTISPMTRLTRKFSWPAIGRRLSLVGKIFGSISETHEVSTEEKSNLRSDSETVLRLEGQRRSDIKRRLQELYGGSGAEKYHHLGPDFSVDKSSLNDVHAMCIPQPRSHEFQKAIEAEAACVVRQHWVEASA